MSEAIYLPIIGIIEMVVTSIVTFLLTKKKYHAEVNNSVIKNMQEALDFYKNVSDDNKKRLEEVLYRNNRLEGEIYDLRKIVLGMMTQICTDVLCQNRKVDLNECPYYSLKNDHDNNKNLNYDVTEDSQITAG